MIKTFWGVLLILFMLLTLFIFEVWFIVWIIHRASGVDHGMDF